jgi:hypothetical protein
MARSRLSARGEEVTRMMPHAQLFQTLFEDRTQQYADKVLAAQATFG